MKILIFSTVFSPSVGGIERKLEVLSAEFALCGHEVRVATMTPAGDEKREHSFPVFRKPRFMTLVSLIAWADVILQANVSLKYAFISVLAPRRTIYAHGSAYERMDGSRGFRDKIKAWLSQRWPGIANSRYTLARLRCSDVVFNPYDNAVFSSRKAPSERSKDLVFLGRLVSEKGVETLLQALKVLADRGIRPTLSIIGEGPGEARLAEMVSQMHLASHVQFLGVLRGPDLARELNEHKVMVVPSLYAEPFGIVALEGLACGCVPVVSETGGLKDAIGSHGVVFPNGRHDILADVLGELLASDRKRSSLLNGSQRHLEHFHAAAVARSYLQVFRRRLIGDSGASSL